VFGAQERTGQINIEYQHPPLERCFLEGKMEGNASVVYQNINAAELLHSFADHILDVGFLANVRLEGQHSSPGGFDSPRYLLKRFIVATATNYNIGPSLGKPQGKGLAHAPPAAGNDSYLTAEFH
jgi:hypothetical protein